MTGEFPKLLITNHFGTKPLNGGRPPNENKDMNKHIWESWDKEMEFWDKDLRLKVLRKIVTVVKIIQ